MKKPKVSILMTVYNHQDYVNQAVLSILSQSYKNFDAIVATYHDQGLIPFKTLTFGKGVNFTAGLDIVRTSPDHGTAYDISGKNIANYDSFKSAIFTSIEIVKNRGKN